MRFAAGDLGYRVTTDASLTAIYEERPFVLAGPMTSILGDDEPINEAPAAFGRTHLDQTRSYWELWVRDLAIPADYLEAVVSALHPQHACWCACE
jgi:hypothetical protein